MLTPQEVLKFIKKSKKAWEALFTSGERPDDNQVIKRKLKRMGFESFVDYVVEMNKLALAHGFLPHTNLGVISKNEMKKLGKWNASLGLMLEQAVELECHNESPGKKPEKRIKTIENAGKLKIPFTTGILVGIGESEYDRIYSLEVISEIHKNYEHIQEVIIQNFMPKKGTPMEDHKPLPIKNIVKTVKIARKILPKEVAIQVPPNLVNDLRPLVKAGANDIGGISDCTPDYINPEHPWPSLEDIKRKLGNAYKLRPRLSIYPRYVKKGWFSDKISNLVHKLADYDGFKKA